MKKSKYSDMASVSTAIRINPFLSNADEKRSSTAATNA